jgi:hypothetical protein
MGCASGAWGSPAAQRSLTFFFFNQALEADLRLKEAALEGAGGCRAEMAAQIALLEDRVRLLHSANAELAAQLEQVKQVTHK